MDLTNSQGIAGEISPEEARAGILPSHGISLDVPDVAENDRPPIIQRLSEPAYRTPIRHHRREPSHHKEVKETLNAKSEYSNSQDDGRSQHHINQYIIKDEIGRGSFGAVHLAVDQYGKEFAVKEFSKSRLRKRAQSNILRRPHNAQRRPGQLAAGIGLNAPLHQHSPADIQDAEMQGNPLYLIKEEIAIMKKLDHPNLVSLIEVLDDPDEDSLYMVLEMCKKGVIMKVGLDERADPYDEESCRCWFRDLILGIEYLHAQGVVHRDIKPDNLLLTQDDVLKIVDFGVSEMFEKQSEMMTAKSAGSPAFLPPELCVAKHGDISGKAADIWSMGVSLYCLRFGKIPFERAQVLELYEAIKNENIDWTPENEPHFKDLMQRILEKDPKRRITMDELRDHPWVTRSGEDPLITKEENVENLVEPPTESEMNHAITTKFQKALVVMKAVTKFKALLGNRRPELRASVLGDGVRIVHPPLFLNESSNYARSSKSVDLDDRRPINTALTAEGVHRDLSTGVSPAVTMLEKEISKETTDAAPLKANAESAIHHQGHHTSGEAVSVPNPGQAGSRTRTAGSVGEKGHAHDPMDEAPLWLGIGASSDHVHLPDVEILADSPTAAEFNIYNTAYQEEVERIRAAQGHETTLYLNRRVDSKQQYKADPNMLDAPSAGDVVGKPHQGWKGVLDAAREKEKALREGEPVSTAEKTDKGPPLEEEAVVEEGTHENVNHENVTPERVTPGGPASNSNVDSSQGPSREKRKLSTKIGSAFKGAMQKVKMTKTPEKVDEAMEDAK